MEHLRGTSGVCCHIILCTCFYCDSAHNIRNRAQHVEPNSLVMVIANILYTFLSFFNSTSTLQSVNAYIVFDILLVDWWCPQSLHANSYSHSCGSTISLSTIFTFNITYVDGICFKFGLTSATCVESGFLITPTSIEVEQMPHCDRRSIEKLCVTIVTVFSNEGSLETSEVVSAIFSFNYTIYNMWAP